jgi:hypothetical protein
MPSLPAHITQVSIAGDSMRGPMLQAGGCQIEKPSARENPLARKHHTWKNSLWSAVGKKSVTPPRRAKSYIPEPIPANQTNQMLELAKGFEPPTL